MKNSPDCAGRKLSEPAISHGIMPAPLFQNPFFQHRENAFVDHDSHKDNDNHDQHDLINVGKVPAHDQRLSKAYGSSHHLARHQCAPCEGPALFQPGYQLREARREEDIQVELPFVSAHGKGGLHINRLDVFNRIINRYGNAERRAHNDDKQDCLCGQSEP